MHFKITRACCMAATLVTLGCSAQSLQEAVLIALADYPTISASKFRTNAAKAEILRAKAPHWPQISWSGTYNDYRSSSLSNRWVQSPSLSLNLWSGRRIQSDIERAEALSKASEQQQTITRDEVALLISEGYLQWDHQRKMVGLAKENLQTHEKILNDFQKIAAVDAGRRIDLNQAEVRFENANLILIRSETELAFAAERVSRMLMTPLPAEPTGIESMPAMPFATLAEALDNLNDQHPVIANLQAQREAAQASVRYAQAQNAPTVNVTHTKITTPGFAEGKFVTQLQLNIPLFDGGNTQGAVGVAMGNLQALEASLQETRRVLGEQLSTHWATWKASERRAQMGLQQTQTAKVLAYGYLQQFLVGRRSLLDLLNIQSDLFTYQSSAQTALYESRISHERILADSGQLAKLYSQHITPKASNTVAPVPAVSTAAVPYTHTPIE